MAQYGKHSKLVTSNKATSTSWKSCTTTRKRRIWQTRRVRFSRSREGRNMETHCPAYSSTPLSKCLWKTTLLDGRRKEEWAFDWKTKPKTALHIYALPTMCCCLLPRWNSCKKMLSEFNRSTEEVGLKIHPRKTKILRNREVPIDDIKVEVLSKEETMKYLGQLITFQQQKTKEIKNLIRAAWTSVQKYRQELTSRHYSLQHRLQLFNMVITPTVNRWRSRYSRHGRRRLD